MRGNYNKGYMKNSLGFLVKMKQFYRNHIYDSNSYFSLKGMENSWGKYVLFSDLPNIYTQRNIQKSIKLFRGSFQGDTRNLYKYLLK